MRKMIAVWFCLLITSKASAMDLEACHEKAQLRLKLNVIASNISNVQTTRTPEGGPYFRQILICNQAFCEITSLSSSLQKYEPGHPDADEYGIVRYPDIDLREELRDMAGAVAAYRVAEERCP